MEPRPRRLPQRLGGKARTDLTVGHLMIARMPWHPPGRFCLFLKGTHDPIQVPAGGAGCRTHRFLQPHGSGRRGVRQDRHPQDDLRSCDSSVQQDLDHRARLQQGDREHPGPEAPTFGEVDDHAQPWLQHPQRQLEDPGRRGFPRRQAEEGVGRDVREDPDADRADEALRPGSAGPGQQGAWHPYRSGRLGRDRSCGPRIRRRPRHAAQCEGQHPRR